MKIQILCTAKHTKSKVASDSLKKFYDLYDREVIGITYKKGL